MTGTSCCVPDCKNNSIRTKNISFHCFPKNQKKRREWIKRINRKKWEPKKFDKICGFHFNISGKKSTEDKLPKYFPNGRVIAEETNKYIYICIQKDLSLGADITISNAVTMQVEDISVDKVDNIDDHTYSINKNKLFKKFQCEKQRLLDKLSNSENEVKRLTEENGKLSRQVAELSSNLRSLRYELKEQKSKILDVNDVLKNNAKLQFYTGFETADRFKIFADFIEPGYNNLKCQRGRKCLLSYTEQLFLILCRLKLGLLEQDLSYRFNISLGTVSNVWTFWVDFLSSQLCQVPIWPSKSLIDKHMPESFKELYPSTRVILDCTELYIETPSDIRIQSATYSNHKAHNTAKGLIGITPNGMISFVSDLYPGRVSNRQIINESDILSRLQASRGFTIEEKLRNINVTLNIPPFLKGASQFGTEDVKKTSDIASLRIHVDVERCIRHVKTFRILKYVFSNSMYDKLNQIWKICCYLCNFIGEPLLDK